MANASVNESGLESHVQVDVKTRNGEKTVKMTVIARETDLVINTPVRVFVKQDTVEQNAEMFVNLVDMEKIA